MHTASVSAELDLLAALIADAPPVPPASERHDILFTPAFNSAVLLTVELGPHPSVRVRSYDVPIWWTLHEHEAARRRCRSELEQVQLGPPALPYRQALAQLSPARAEPLRVDLARHLPALGRPETALGRDGIGLDVQVLHHDAAPLRFAAWSPESGDPRHPYFASMHALAFATIDDTHALAALAVLRGYLCLGLCARDRGGYPRTLQLFEDIGDGDAAALTRLLAAPSPTEAVLVDARHLTGVTHLVRPRLQQFSARPGATGWVVTPVSRQLLKSAGVPGNQMRDDLSAAILLVAVNDAARRR